MRLGVNALGQIRGGTLEHLAQLLARWAELVRGSDHRVILFASNGTLQRIGKIPEGIEVHPVPAADRGVLHRVVAEQFLLPRLCAGHLIDVLFCPASTMPRFSSTPCVVMLQNAAPFLPRRQLRGFSFAVRVRMAVLRSFILMSARNAKAIIYLSEYFKKLIQDVADSARPADTVLYHARLPENKSAPPMLEALKLRLGITRPYLLCVSHIYPYKNLLELIEGFGLLKTDDVQLVLVGSSFSHDTYSADVNSAAQRTSRFNNQVLLTGGLPHLEVQALLSGCLAFVFPSTCENCPIGLIEALSYRVPIACSDVGVMPEIVGKAAVLFDPYRPVDIARALHILLTEPKVREQLSDRCDQELVRFGTPSSVADASWRVCAEAVDHSLAGQLPGYSESV